MILINSRRRMSEGLNEAGIPTARGRLWSEAQVLMVLRRV
jgi:hypothetical protein